MRGKLDIRFNMPEVSKLRTRIESPDKGLTQELRAAAAEIACEVINENVLSFKAKMIERVSEMGLDFKDAKAEASVKNVMGGIFNIATAPTTELLDALCGTGDGDETTGEEVSEPGEPGYSSNSGEEFE